MIYQSILAVNLIFSFTNGVDWDGPYRLQFQVPKRWQNKPIEFFNEVYIEFVLFKSYYLYFTNVIFYQSVHKGSSEWVESRWSLWESNISWRQHCCDTVHNDCQLDGRRSMCLTNSIDYKSFVGLYFLTYYVFFLTYEWLSGR